MNTLNRIIKLFITLAVMMAGVMLATPAANAADYGSTITNESTSSAVDNGTVTSKATATGKITAKTVFYVKASGTPKSQQTNCVRTKKAASYWTSYLNAAGQEVWHWKKYPKGKKFCKIGGIMRDPVCHNKVKIGVPKAKKPKGRIIKGKITVKKSMTYVAEAKATTTAKATSTVKAWCTGTGNSAEAYAQAYAYGYASARAKAKASTKAGAEAKAKSEARKAAASVKVTGEAKTSALATARASATTQAKAKVTCTDVPPTVPPTPEKPKVNIEIDTLNDVDLTDPNCEGTRTECESYLVSTVHATVPSGVSGTVRISSNIGTVGFTNGTPTNPLDDVKTLNLGSGQHDIKYRFNAPTEGTSAVITFTFTPSGDSAVTPEPVSTRVVLNTPPTPPL